MIKREKLDDRINQQLDLIAWCQVEAKKSSGSGELLSTLIRDLQVLCELARDCAGVFSAQESLTDAENTGANSN